LFVTRAALPCKKAQKWLEENQRVFQVSGYKNTKPAKRGAEGMAPQEQLPLSRFFNTSGRCTERKNLKERLKTMQEDEMLDLLASDGMWLKDRSW
jgi:arsenate reductase